MKISVKDTINSTVAISAKKGQLVFDVLQKALKNNETVELDFLDITDLTTAFLNVAIGHLYNEFSSEELNQKLTIINIDELDLYLVSQVIERVKLNKQSELEKIIKGVMNDGDDS